MADDSAGLRDLREKRAALQWHLDYCAGQMQLHRENADAYGLQIDALREELARADEEILRRTPALPGMKAHWFELEVVQ